MMDDPLLNCNICYESFTECVPKILSCGHTICSDCAQRIVNNKKISCPTCKQSTTLTSNNISQLPTNFTVKNLAEEKGKNILCKEHTKNFVLFCEHPSCMKLICGDCTTHRDENHPYKFIEEAAKNYREKLLVKVEGVQSTLKKITEEAKLINNSIFNLQKDRKVAERKVKDTMNELREFIDKRENHLLDQIRISSQRTFSILNRQFDDLIQKEKPIEILQHQLIQNITDDKSQQSLLDNLPQYHQQIDQITNLNFENKDTNEHLIELKNIETQTERMKDLISNFGEIAAKFNKDVDFYEPLNDSFSTIQISPLQNRDYNQLLPNGNQIAKKIIGQELGENVVKFNGPHCISILPKEWISNSGESASAQQQKKRKILNDDLLVISDSKNNRVVLIEKTTGKIHSVIGGTQGSELGSLNAPMGLGLTKSTSHPNWILLVADYENNRIQSFDIETGKYLQHFTHGEYMQHPSSLAVHPQNGQIIVLNNNTNITVHNGYQINSNTMSDNEFGSLIKVINLNESIYGLCLNSNNNIMVSSADKIYVVNSYYEVIKNFEKRGCQFRGVYVDKYDNILVCDKGNQRIQIFDRNGNWINAFGKEGSGVGGFVNPSDVLVDPETGDILVVDNGNNRVLSF